jgi:hypothetical protein
MQTENNVLQSRLASTGGGSHWQTLTKLREINFAREALRVAPVGRGCVLLAGGYALRVGVLRRGLPLV